jgi:glycerophosphoryl diester phosphodiesterase
MRRVLAAAGAALFLATAGAAEAAVVMDARAGVAPAAAIRAHRGGLHSDLVENTALNFRAAAAEGRLAWEADIRFTSTEVPVILHDPDLRLFSCPAKAIAATTVTAARACLAPNGQHLATLYEVLVELRAAGANAWVELKTVPTAVEWAQLDPRLAPYRDRIVVESFLVPALAAATAHGYATALLTTQPVAPTALPPGTDWYAPAWRQVTAAQVQAMHAAGVKVAVWTVDTLDRPLVAEGIDELLSNDTMVP